MLDPSNYAAVKLDIERCKVLLTEDSTDLVMKFMNLFDFTNSIPNQHLIQNGYGKYVLREAMNGILNDQVRLDRRKKGFNASINSLFDFSDKNTRDYFLDSSSAIFDLVNIASVEQMISSKEAASHNGKFLFSFINCKIFLEQQLK